MTRAGPNPAENCLLIHVQRNKSVSHTITSAFKKTDFVGDMTLYIELRGHVYHIVLNAHVPIKCMSDGSRDVFYGEVSGYPISSLRNI